MSLGLLAIVLLVGAAVLALALVFFENEFGSIIGGSVCLAVGIGYGMTLVVVKIGGQRYSTTDLVLAAAQSSVIALLALICLFVYWRLQRGRQAHRKNESAE